MGPQFVYGKGPHPLLSAGSRAARGKISDVPNGLKRAVPWLRRLTADLPPRRPGFDPGSVHVGFVINEYKVRDKWQYKQGILPCYQLPHIRRDISKPPYRHITRSWRPCLISSYKCSQELIKHWYLITLIQQFYLLVLRNLSLKHTFVQKSRKTIIVNQLPIDKQNILQFYHCNKC
jgi:hypothetical protein